MNAYHLHPELRLYVQNERKEFSDKIEGDKKEVFESGLTELITIWRLFNDGKVSSFNVSWFDSNTILIRKD